MGLSLLMFCSINSAQEPRSQVLKVDVDLVMISVAVSDTQGHIVTGLRAENFEVWEDKVEQKIEDLSGEDVPLSTGIVLDVSGSMAGKLSKAQEAARVFLAAGNNNDEYFLVQFSDRAQLIEQFTTDTFQLQKHFIFNPAKGRTALFDAVYLGLEKLKGHGNRRKALVLITDGEDNHSHYTFSDIKEYAKEQGVQIFVIGIVDLGPWINNGRLTIGKLAEITGGKAFFPTSVEKLEGISSEIATELKNQYVVAYHSSNEAKDGTWRKIQVKVIPPKGMGKLIVRTKNGYYAPSCETPR